MLVTPEHFSSSKLPTKIDSKSMLSLPEQSRDKYLNETNHDVTKQSDEIKEVQVVMESERKVRKGRKDRKMAISRLEKTQVVSVIDHVVDTE